MMSQNSCTSKEKLLQRIYEVSFAVDDILLFLDTHPFLSGILFRTPETDEGICPALWSPYHRRCP